MNYLDTWQALMSKLSRVRVCGLKMTPMTSGGDVAISNSFSEPINKDLWISVHLIPVSSGSTGKTIDSADECAGIFQISVFVSLNSGGYDIEQFKVVDGLLKEFYCGSLAEYRGHMVEITGHSVNNGTENESWFKRDISINYTTFNKRK